MILICRHVLNLPIIDLHDKLEVGLIFMLSSKSGDELVHEGSVRLLARRPAHVRDGTAQQPYPLPQLRLKIKKIYIIYNTGLKIWPRRASRGFQRPNTRVINEFKNIWLKILSTRWSQNNILTTLYIINRILRIFETRNKIWTKYENLNNNT